MIVLEGKTCLYCNTEKPISEFHKQKGMADGYRNQCKVCGNKDCADRYYERMNDPAWKEKERKRNRIRMIGAKRSRSDRKTWESNNREKIVAASVANRMISCPRGFQRHHWSYNKEHYLSVIILTRKHHLKAHRFLVYDKDRMMYRRFDTLELLDTMEKHKRFILLMVDTMED